MDNPLSKHCQGVFPILFFKFSSAPLWISISAISKLWKVKAKCKGVLLFLLLVLGFAPTFNK